MSFKHLLFDTFNIHSTIVEPLCIYPKASIPLHFFDFVLHDELPARTFRAENEALESYLCYSANIEPQVIIAQLNHSSHLAAIERIQQGLYSITKFSPKVDSASFKSTSYHRSARPTKVRRTEQTHEVSEKWWEIAALPLEPSVVSNPIEETSRSRRNLPKVNDVQKSREDAHEQSPLDDPSPNLAEQGPAYDAQNDNDAMNTVLAPGDVALRIARQYVEALYLSKTSLAYFPKSTLSRARSALGELSCNAGRVYSFLDFIRAMVLSISALDKKHRQVLPDAVRKLAIDGNGTNGSSLHQNARGKKPKKLKKAKPGKDGLYSIEFEALEQWWHSQEVGGESDPKDDQVRGMLAQLRIRETLLQIIMIMEILAIEAQLASSTTAEGQENYPSRQEESENRASQSKPQKRKRPLDMEATLDMLVDRLCIWQSIEAADIDSKARETKAKTGEDHTARIDAGGSDQLRDFYHHVLIPFYAPRLPDKIRALGKKIGISSQTSPTRQHPKSIASKVGPGTELLRRPRTKKELFRPPSLSRSATDPLLRVDARERSSRSASTKLSQREVNMAAVTHFRESKKKFNVDKELQEAIATLKKPNRTKAVQDYIDVEVGATPRKDSRQKKI